MDLLDLPDLLEAPTAPEPFDLLRMKGFRSIGGEDDKDGSIIVDVALSDPELPQCRCDEPDVVRHGKREVRYRDHPIQRHPTYLRLIRQRYRCRACGAVLLEHLPGIDANHVMTERFRLRLAQDGVERTFTDAANINGVQESLVRRVFKEYAAELLADYQFTLPRVLGMDEKVLGGVPRFVIGDIEKRTILDMQPSRKAADLERYFGSLAYRFDVEVITQDMYWAYKELNQRYFRKATIVIDKFHVVRYANMAVETVRKQIQSTLDNDGRIAMKRKNRLLAARTGNLSDEGSWQMSRLFKAHPILEKAVEAKEFFYGIYDCPDRASAEREFNDWLALLPKELEGPFKPLLSCMRSKRWQPLILNYFDHPYTNAYTEAMNGLFDQMNRLGRGYDFDTIRSKAILRYGKLTRAIDEWAFDIRSDEDMDQAERMMIGHGVDLSTFEADLAGGRF